MRTLKVAVDAVGLAPGGGLTYLLNQAPEFERDRRWRLTYFVAPRCRDRLTDVVGTDNVRVPFSRSPGYTRRAVWEQITLPRLLEQEGFDLLYVPLAFAVFRSPVPQVVLDQNPNHHAGVTELGLGRLFVRVWIEKVAAKTSARRAEVVVYVSRSFTDAMMAAGFPEPTCIIPSGVAADWPAATGAPLPLQCETCASEPFVLAVHNWYRHKRLEWLVEAWAGDERLRRRHLVVVGRPIGRRAESKVRSLTSRPDVTRAVHLLADAPREAVAALYRRAHLYVSAATLEAFPLTPFEAMSFGVPCVLSDIPPHREIAGDAAVYFRPGDVVSLAAALELAEESRAALRRAAREVATISWATNVRLLTEQFELLVPR